MGAGTSEHIQKLYVEVLVMINSEYSDDTKLGVRS